MTISIDDFKKIEIENGLYKIKSRRIAMRHRLHIGTIVSDPMMKVKFMAGGYIGVIEELQKRGYEITSIAGTSMGALIGGMFATGKMDEFKNWICSLDKMKVFSLVGLRVGRLSLATMMRLRNSLPR